MQEILRLSLLGPPQILIDDQPLTGFATNKAQALLFYLAVTARAGTHGTTPHSRDTIATLLWGEMSDAQAKQNLRSVLPNLRRTVGDHLHVDRQTIAFDHTSPYWLDVEVLRSGLRPGQPAADVTVRQALVDLYRGEFLSGFYVHRAPAFEAWVLEQREQLHTLVVDALFSLVQDYTECADYAAALAANRRLLGMEPWSEPVHRQQMVLLARTGKRSAALAQYEACRHILAEEFGVEPLPETVALYEQIRSGAEVQNGNRSASDAGTPAIPPTEAQEEPQEQAFPENRPFKPEPARLAVEQEAPSTTDDSPPLQVIGYNVPLRTKLYGRQQELTRVQQWITHEGCHLVGIFGIGGQGKTALAAAVVRHLAEPAGQNHDFRFVIWQSMLNAPPLSDVMQEWFYALSQQTVTSLPANRERQFAQLLEYLRQHRTLLVLDNVESILHGSERSGYYQPGYEEYGQLIRHLAMGGHRSCLLLTGRERPHDLTHMEDDAPGVRFLALAGLSVTAGSQMIESLGMAGDADRLGALVRHYSGNPLALKLVAETVHSIFGGNIAAFLRADTLVFDDIRDVLEQQFVRLTPLEYELMLWLAVAREPVAFNELRELLAQSPAPHLVLESMRSLQRRSLLEQYDAGFGLPNVVLEYCTELLIENIGHELVEEQRVEQLEEHISISHGSLRGAAGGSKTLLPALLPHSNRHALVLAQVKEYVRTSQTRLLLQPVAAYLADRLGSAGTVHHLQRLLARMRMGPPTPGYAAANILHILLHLKADLSEYDFSRLYFRQLYLRGVSLPQTNFAHAEILDSSFTEPFGLVYAVMFSPDGQYLAAGTSEGAIYIWRTADQQLEQVIQAHGQNVNELSFALRTTVDGERELVLASASDEGRVGFWTLGKHEPSRWHVHLSHEESTSVLGVGLSADGYLLTSVDNEGYVYVWDLHKRKAPQLIRRFMSTPTSLRLVAYSGDGLTVVVGNRDGSIHVHHVVTGESGPDLVEPTGALLAVALRHDGRMMATGSEGGNLCLWALPSGRLMCVVETQSAEIDALAFSSDGMSLASTHRDYAVRVWSIDAQMQLHLRHTLLGHSQLIWTTVFGPSARAHTNGRNGAGAQLLASGGSDQTVCVWDANLGQSLYALRGQPRALSMIAVTPPPDELLGVGADSRQRPEWVLATAGYDRLVRVWQGSGIEAHNLHRVLQGAQGPLFAVCIGPDGRTVAASGADGTIYLWDLVNGELLRTLRSHTNSVFRMVFHPRNALLVSCSTDGTICLWDLHTLAQAPSRSQQGPSSIQPIDVIHTPHQKVYNIAFSPDGRLLASVGADPWLHLWEMLPEHASEPARTVFSLKLAGEPDLFSVAMSPDGRKIACGGNYRVYLWDVAEGVFEGIVRRDVPREELVRENVADGSVGAATSGERQNRSQLGGDDQPLVLQQHTTWVYSLAFSPDSSTLASGSADSSVCLWNTADGSLRAVLQGHSDTVYSVAFTPDGKHVVSCSFDGTILFWDVQTGGRVNSVVVEGPYAGMNITGTTGITQAQRSALRALGAVDECE